MKRRLIIAIDRGIPFWEAAFSPLGEVRPFEGRKLPSSYIRDADALIVRTATRVDAGTLEGSAVRFVGSATIGMDHLDEPYLNSRGIAFSNAAGCNANAVSEYFVAALLVLAQDRKFNLQQKSIGIIGAGRVGSRVAGKAQALGLSVSLCDPPLRESTQDPAYLSLAEVLDQDILSLHVPLTKEGKYPTLHMIDEAIFDRLEPHQLVINAARGSVIDGNSLKAALQRGAISGAVLDVWENEPRIDTTLLDLVDIGTSHIAGYSLNGKIRATEMILEALCRHFGCENPWDSAQVYPRSSRIRPAPESTGQDALHSVVLQAYNIQQDDANLRALRSLAPDPLGRSFDRLRDEYPLRAEFRHFIVGLPPKQSHLEATLGALGFQIEEFPARAVSEAPDGARA
jgi:erythronate-4-phosphate dehydrogenase